MKKIIFTIIVFSLLIACGSEKKEVKKENKNEFEQYIDHRLEQIDKAEAAVEKLNKNNELMEKTSKELNKE